MKIVKEWKKASLADLIYVVSELKEVLTEPSVLILSGEVGAGKTTLVQSFTDLPETTSPSYSVINEFGDILHADFYRLKNREELVHLELSLYLEGKNFFFIEWGMEYLNDLKRELGFEYNYYELSIDIYESKEIQSSFRNYTLKSIDKFN